MKNKSKILLLVLLGVTVITRGQMVGNTGLMHINAGTTMGIVSDFDNRDTGTLWNDGELYLFSNLNNDGLMSFTPDENGNTRFEGFSKQNITGSLPVEFKNVLFNNSSAHPAIELHTEISVAKQANFIHGIVKNKDNGGLVVFEQGSEQVNTNHDSYIEGAVRKIGKDAFIFPIGHEGYFRHCAIAATSDVLSSFGSHYLFENSGSLYPHDKRMKSINLINDKEYWVLEKHGGTAEAILTLSWDETTTTPTSITDLAEDIQIVRWDETKNIWVNEGGVVDLDNRTVSTPISVSGYGVFTLATATRSNSGPCRKLVIYNAISPNGDGKNDYLKIDGLRDCVNGGNTVQIFDRWGVKVFETHNYGENGNFFNGYSNVKSVISGNKPLASGTYFYVIEMRSDSQSMNKTGYLYIN